MLDFLSDLLDQGGTPFSAPESGERAVFDRLDGPVMFAGVQDRDGDLGVGLLGNGERGKKSQRDEAMHQSPPW